MTLHLEQSKPLLRDSDSSRTSQDSLDGYPQPPVSARRKRIILKLVALVHPAHLTTLCKRLGWACVPQLLRSRYWDEHATPTKIFPTSYLNGFRGMTAIKVFTFHYMMAFSDFTYEPWRMDERHDRLLLAPIIRYFYSGFTSQIFFVIAGYLTSLRLFQLLDKNDVASQAKVLSSVAGSLFRRGFRLYFPVFIITFIMSTYIYSGFYENNRQYIQNKDLFPGPWNETKPVRFETFREQTNSWGNEMYHLTDVTKPETVYPELDQHLWSILSEMRASLHLYGCLITLATCKRYARLAALVFTTYLFFTWNSWETWIYLLGAVVAQIDLILTEREQERKASTISPIETDKDTEKQAQLDVKESDMSVLSRTENQLDSMVDIAIRWGGFLLAFYFLSYPITGADEDRIAPGYVTLNRFIPLWMDRKDKFYPNIGAALLLFLLVRSDPQTSKWRRLLMSPIPQYLGSISFALYLVHGIILHMFGYMIPHRIWWLSGNQGAEVGDMAWAAAIFVGWAISIMASLAVADVWTREVEGRCVRLVKKIESLCFKSK